MKKTVALKYLTEKESELKKLHYCEKNRLCIIGWDKGFLSMLTRIIWEGHIQYPKERLLDEYAFNSSEDQNSFNRNKCLYLASIRNLKKEIEIAGIPPKERFVDLENATITDLKNILFNSPLSKSFKIFSFIITGIFALLTTVLIYFTNNYFEDMKNNIEEIKKEILKE